MANSENGLSLGNKIIIVGVAAVGVTAISVYALGVLGLDLSLGLAVGAALGALVAMAGSKWAASSLDKGMAVLQQFVESGDAGVLAQAGSGGELGSLLSVVESALDAAGRETAFAQNCLKSLRNPILVTDADGKVILATQALLDLVKKPMTQVVGFKDSQVLWGSLSNSPSGRAFDSAEGFVDTTEEFTSAGGEEFTLRVFASRVVDGAGTTCGAVISILDMHALIAKQEEMEEQQARIVSIGKEMSLLAERVASASEELSASADEQASGAMRQKEQTDTVATAMEEMTSTVLEVAQNASATSEAASEANENAREGVTMVNQAVSAIHGVSDSADKLEEMVQQLDHQSGQIGKIISVINDIADQTNLLALNAAIEAARAGEAGRGFAVVADEVRKLAEKTMVATKEVEAAIKTIQERSEMLMKSMEETGKQVDASTDMANKAGDSLQVIMEAIEDMVMRASQIATAAEEQSAAAEEINESIENIAQVAREADEGAGQTASATRDMAELSQQLLGVAMKFSGKEHDSSKLRKSENEMKGVLPKLMQEFVKETYGEATYNILQEELGEPVFLPTASYPDQVFVQMAEIAGREAGVSVRDVFLAVGRYTMTAFARMYPRYLKDEPLKSFYLRMNELHAQLTKAQPGIQPPNFTYEDKGEVLFMNYRSKRGFFDYFEGILLGASEFMNEPIEVVVKPLDETTARAEIRFL